ncbi:MAG: ABC transporter permease [Spirochaetaceae bacterium]|nr:ABC transporter permease [Spirochaetaceae bacterium]
MRRSAWMRFVSKRWFAARRASGGSASAVLAAAGIGVGVAALVVVLGVMNGFQLGYVESILEISSFHLRIEDERAGGPDEGLLAALAARPGARSVLPFAETQVILSTAEGRSLPIKLRALPSDAARRDPALITALGLNPAEPELFPAGGGLVLGAELARYLNLSVGEEIEVLAVSSDPEEGVETRILPFRVARTYRSGYYDFDFGLGFVSFEDAEALFPREGPVSYVYGVKLEDRYADGAFAAGARAILAGRGLPGTALETWRRYNRSFFGALKTEKTLMMLLVGLIFLVVGVNINHAMRRAVAERMEDIALLKAVGGGAEELRSVFVLEGLAIGAGGAFFGLLAGLLIAVNVNEVFGLVEALVNGAVALWARLSGGGGADFRVFSPQYFYLMEVPVRVLFPETLFIVAAAVASAAAAAGSAAARVSGLAPAEVLRYE